MRSAVRATCLAGLTLLPSAASAQQAEPPGPYVADARLVMTNVPLDPAFFPSVPSGTPVPTRALGFDLGGHVYLFGLGPGRVGIGASFVRTRGIASPPETRNSSGQVEPQTRPDVETTTTAVVPQLSLNFGSSAGWSYVSVGIGQTRFRSAASDYRSDSGGSESTVAREVLELDGSQTINVGGGARWFMTNHVAFNFDVRFHLVAARGTDAGRTPKATMLAAGLGLSFR